MESVVGNEIIKGLKSSMISLEIKNIFSIQKLLMFSEKEHQENYIKIIFKNDGNKLLHLIPIYQDFHKNNC